MPMSVLEILAGAQINLVNNRGNPLAFALGSSQLDNAIRQLERNPDASADFDEDAEEIDPQEEEEEFYGDKDE